MSYPIPIPRQRRSSFYGPPAMMVSPQHYSPQHYSPPREMGHHYGHPSMGTSPTRQRRNSMASSSGSYSPRSVDSHMHQQQQIRQQQQMLQLLKEDQAVAREIMRERRIEDPHFDRKVRADRHYAAHKLEEFTQQAAYDRMNKNIDVRIKRRPDVKFITPRPGHQSL